jgi:DNA-binding NarL/FixJ family response regulator
VKLVTSPISQPIRLLIVGHHPISRAGLRLLIESRPGIVVVGEAGSPADAVGLATSHQPDIILIDLTNHSVNNFDYLPSLLEAAKDSRVLVLAEVQDKELQHLAVRLGAMGVVFKDRAPSVLMTAIEKVHTGEAWIDRFTVATVLTAMSRNNGVPKAAQADEDIGTLTDREREVITLVALGLRNKQIAERLFISDITVRHHLTSAFSKLGVADRFELMIYAYRHGLADPPVSRFS